ncbi:hypothetical protein MLD38_039093 [Melastoma candidum]|uniref:Uncharacterized protein n=1 Tax=Melastoma candidum TaxID=119954 RepID=A0ACB9L101_9MYRT|nr:hypothetical protein MLD38_039093 [Melastoma candidum]
MSASDQSSESLTHPSWYSPDVGIYCSRHRPIPLPDEVDFVTYLLSQEHGGKHALVDLATGSTMSYCQLHTSVKCMASRLHEMGVTKGDVVLVLLPNCVYYPIVVLGVIYLGAVITTMNPASSESEVKQRVRDCKVRTAFCGRDRASELSSLGVPEVIAVPENPGDVENWDRGCLFHEMVYGKMGMPPPKRSIGQEDTAAIIYSSGTTGPSKGVILTHQNLISMLELFVKFEASQYEYPSTDNVYLAVLPMFHIYGLSLFVMGLLAIGTRVVVMQRFDLLEAIEAIDKYGVTHFPMVPPILLSITTRFKTCTGGALLSLKQVSCGAAPTNRKWIEDFRRTFPNVDFIQGYGMTESAAVGTRGFNTGKIYRYTSIGLLAPNMEAKVADLRTGSPLPPGRNGELLLRGPAIMKGYLNNPEATRLTINEDGWLHTGDIVYFDRDGYIYVVDRLKEIIKYKGYQVPPADLEGIMITHPDIDDVAVAGLLHEECGEIPAAFVVRRRGSSLSEEAVKDYVAKQVASYKKVRKVIFVSAVPRSPSGKILRRELRESITSRL